MGKFKSFLPIRAEFVQQQQKMWKEQKKFWEFYRKLYKIGCIINMHPIVFYLFNPFNPGYIAKPSKSFSMFSNLLYFATLSVLHGAPVFI